MLYRSPPQPPAIVGPFQCLYQRQRRGYYRLKSLILFAFTGALLVAAAVVVGTLCFYRRLCWCQRRRPDSEKESPMIIWRCLLWLLAILGLLFFAFCKPCLAAEPSLRTFLDAVRYWESRGDDRAVGDSGRSRGPLQCGRAAWKEGCEFLGVTWSYDKCVWKRFESEAVLIAYTHRWGARTLEERARCWNSGPKWRKKYRATNEYWRRIRCRMKGTER